MIQTNARVEGNNVTSKASSWCASLKLSLKKAVTQYKERVIPY